MTNKQEIIKYNDNLLTNIAKVKYPSLGHHIIHRANLLYRYDFNNLVAVSREEHNRIHFEANGNIEFIKSLPLNQQLWIEEHKNDSFKDYLLKHGQTEIEFLIEKKKQLELILDIKNDMLENNCIDKTVKLRQIKQKSKKHQDKLEKQRQLRKENYKRLKKYKKVKNENKKTL